MNRTLIAKLMIVSDNSKNNLTELFDEGLIIERIENYLFVYEPVIE